MLVEWLGRRCHDRRGVLELSLVEVGRRELADERVHPVLNREQSNGAACQRHPLEQRPLQLAILAQLGKHGSRELLRVPHQHAMPGSERECRGLAVGNTGRCRQLISHRQR